MFFLVRIETLMDGLLITLRVIWLTSHSLGKFTTVPSFLCLWIMDYGSPESQMIRNGCVFDID